MISLASLQDDPRPVQVGDIIYFFGSDFDFKSISAFGRWLYPQSWFQPCLKGLEFLKKLDDSESSIQMISHFCIDRLVETFIHGKAAGENLPWISLAPKEVVRYLEYKYLYGNSPIEPLALVGDLPYAGFGYIVVEEYLLEKLGRALGVCRLGGIKQLSGLTDPTLTNGPLQEYPQTFGNTRLLHSFDTCAVATLIGLNCGLAERDFLTLRACAFAHDTMTPAGGDAVKRIDMDGLDEDRRFPEAFLQKGWPEVRTEYGLQEPEMANVILGQGLLGRILDLSDKIAYVGRDMFWFFHKNPAGHTAWWNFREIYDRMTSLLSRNPNPSSVWECARVINGQLVISDPARLADFLRIRAAMFKILYFNAASRFAETGYLTQICRYLYQDGILTKQNLVEMSDQDLFCAIEKTLGCGPFSVGHVLGRENPRVETFPTAEEALEFERNIAWKEPQTMTCLDIHPNPAGKPSSDFMVLAGGKVMPFSEACPADADDIRTIMADKLPYRVFLYNLELMCPSQKMQRRIVADRKKRIGI